MEEIMFQEPMYKVYIKTDENNVVVRVDSEWNINDLTGWIYIDEGTTDRFHHAQSGYLEKGLFDEQGRFNYKYANSTLTELTEEEKVTLFPVVEVVSTTLEDVMSVLNKVDTNTSTLVADIEQNAIDEFTLELMESGVL